MSEGTVHLERAGSVAKITFDRPAARNAMTWTMYEQLAAHCVQLAGDGSVRVVTLRGAGGEAFVAGTDISQFHTFTSGEDGVAYEQRIDQGIALIERLPMPTVAIVEGWCVGGGLAIATACDFRLATPSARFGAPIARTLGNMYSVPNLARCRTAWGDSRVRRMILLAESIHADEALACGYLHGMHEPAELDTAAADLCERLAGLAPVTQAVTKEALRRLTGAALPDADDLIRRCYGSEDFREGVASFTARRKPVWRGR